MSAPVALTVATHRALAPERARLREQAGAVLRTQVAIAGIHSPTFGEAARAEHVRDLLAAAGWAARRDDAGNVVARLGTGDHPVAVCAHLDTVYPDAPVPVEERSGRVVGSGICDNSRGLAALVAIAQVLAARAPALPHPIELVATTCEEGAGDLRGARHYVEAARPNALIALDGAGDEGIVTVGLGSRRFRVSFRGPGGHSWSAFGIANPVHAAARCAAAIASLRRPAGAAVTVSRIGGGSAVNAIPEDAWLEVDVRAVAESSLDRLEGALRRAAASTVNGENDRRASGAGLACTVEVIGRRPSGHTDERSPLVTACIEATRLAGRRPALATSSTDANAAMAAGIPAVAIGAGGRGGDVHTSHEWFEDADGATGIARALTIIATAARLADA